MVTSAESKSYYTKIDSYLWRSRLALIEEPEKDPKTLGLEDPDVWGDAAENVSPRHCANLDRECQISD